MGKRKFSFELFISLLAMAAAGLSAYATYVSVKQSGQIAKFQAFIMLRAEFMVIQKSFPPDYRKKGVEYPVDSKEWRALSRYWYHTFNEWAITTRFGHKDLRDL